MSRTHINEATYRSHRKDSVALLKLAHVLLFDPKQAYKYGIKYVTMTDDERKISVNELLHKAYEKHPHVVESNMFKKLAEQCCWPLRLGDSL